MLTTIELSEHISIKFFLKETFNKNNNLFIIGEEELIVKKKSRRWLEF